MNLLASNIANRGGAANAPFVEWLDLDAVADVTITARGERLARVRSMWSADCPGEQMIEIRFHHPTAIRRLRVIATEAEASRTQEMTVWASLNRGERHREVLRQQFTFSPDGATEEIEEYVFDLDDVSALQLHIVPSVDGRLATAHIRELRVASAAYGAGGVLG
jgi:hypothetical protein